MLKPLTEREKQLIVNNVVKAVKNIDDLNKTGYKFLYLASGFIAHHNQYGFIEHYRTRSLKDAIFQNKRMNQWANFREGERDYEYYMAKKDVYNRICERI